MVLTLDSKLIVGAALEGINECLWTSDLPETNVSGQMEFVISPAERGSEVLVGVNARASRLDLGMPWPPEARIDPDRLLQRIPVPLLWRSLVHDRTGSAEWVTTTNSRKHADMLAAHILDRLGEYENAAEFLIAIPDQLSDFSQQKLLDAFSRKGKRNVGFIWNPIALALLWLEELGDTFSLNRADRDYLLVLHLGAGGLDCTKFLLREKKFNNKTYICPIRSGGGRNKSVDVLDLVNMRIQNALDSIDSINASNNRDASWFCLGVPEVWEPSTRQKEGESKLFNLDGAWQLLSTNNLNGSTPVDSRLRTDLPIHGLLDPVYSLSRDDLEGASWDELIDELLTERLRNLDGNLRGVIVGGLPFAQRDNEWSLYVSKRLSKRIEGGVVTKPTPDAIWNTGEVSIAIATGAGVYGLRRQSGLPTYFDVLPYLGVHAEEEGQDDNDVDELFVPLIPDGSEAEGGKPYMPPPITNLFFLPEGLKELEVILELEDRGERTLRKATFRFPHGPDRPMPLDVHVQVQTAGGLPTVEIIPEDATFLGGSQVYLDWKSMEEIERDQLPKRALGWPPCQVSHQAIPDAQPQSTQSRNLLRAVSEFLAVDLSFTPDSKYLEKTGQLQNAISRGMRIYGSDEQFRIVDVAGRTPNKDTAELIKELRTRLDQNFGRTLDGIEKYSGQKRKRLETHRDQLITVGTWLFGATPKSIRKYLEQFAIGAAKVPFRYVHSYSRIASSEKDICSFFELMEGTAQQRSELPGRWYPNYWLYGAKRILASNPDAPKFVNRNTMNDIVEGLIDDFGSWAEDPKKGFAITLMLLFYMLRVRRFHKNFISRMGDATDNKLYMALKDVMEEARKKLPKSKWKQNRIAVSAVNGLEEFLDYEGSRNTLLVLRQFDPEAKADDEDSG
jgi:hypothetical protein